MKGIILAGGLGSRLNPLTKVVSKQLLPVFNKPLIYYPLSTLMLASIKEILIIATPNQIKKFKEFLLDGRDFGIELSFKIQPQPLGIAESLILGENFISGNKSALILGDNLFHGSGTGRSFKKYKNINGVQIFGYKVKNPESYGIATLSSSGIVTKLEEKPKNTNSNIAVPGLYFFDETASERSKSLKPGVSGELEIVDLLNSYLNENQLNLEMLPRGTAWFDCGTFEDLYEAGTYVRIMEKRTGEKVGDPVEIAKLQGWI